MKRFGAIGIVVAFLALVIALALPRHDSSHGLRPAKTKGAKTPRGVRWERSGDARSVPASGPGRLAVAGRVVDALTGEPIEDATVSLRTEDGEEIAAADSDRDGSFSFSGFAGPAILAASAPGYAFLTEDVEGEDVVLALDPSVRLSGVVVDPSGEPVAGAEVWAEDAEGDDWERWPRPASDTTTSASDGSFTVEDAPSGRLVVHATHARFARGETEVGGVGPGRTRDGIRVALQHGGRIAGRVVDEGGAPAAGAEVMLYPEDERATKTTSGADGSFVFDGVAAGRVVVTARIGDDEGSDMFEVSPRETSTVELRLGRLGKVAGRVLDENRAPIAGAQVFLRTGGPDTKSAYAGEDGRFAITGFSGESVRIRVVAKGFESAVRIVERGVSEDIVLERADVATVFGTVTLPSGKRAARATVYAKGKGREFMDGGDVEPDGTWRLELEPGVYRFQAEAAGHADSAPVIVTVESGAPPQGPIALSLGQSGRVRGRVVGPDGQPIAGARVSLSRRGRTWSEGEEHARLDWSGYVRTDPQGRFELPADAGEVALFVYHPEMHAEVVRVTVPADGAADAGTIYLREGEGASAIFEFSGIGCVIRYDEGRLEVGGVLPGSPADRAGVREGDGIEAIDGVETAPMNLEEVITRIRGPVGTTVTLTLRREGNPAPLEIHVVREKIRS